MHIQSLFEQNKESTYYEGDITIDFFLKISNTTEGYFVELMSLQNQCFQDCSGRIGKLQMSDSEDTYQTIVKYFFISY